MIAPALAGLVVAFVGSLPVSGPGAVLVADAALGGAPRRGAWIGAGAAVPEAAWATLAFLGAGTLVDGVPELRALAHGIAAVALLAVAVHLWRRDTSTPATRGGEGRAFLLGVLSTAFNPTLAVTWGAVAGTLVALGWARTGLSHALAFGMGVGAGSVAAGIVVAATLARVRRRLGASVLARLGRGVAVFVGALGVLALVRAAGP